MKSIQQEKKGQLQIQFAWIFIIIVGVALLLFLFSIISSQAKTSDQKISISLAKHFETILTTTGQESGTIKEYVVPLAEVEFTCDDQEGLYGFSVNDIAARSTKYDIIFSPKNLHSNKIYTWTQEWMAPYSVATFLYVTSNKHAYVFLNGTSSFSEEIRTYFPKNFTQINMYVEDGELKNAPSKNLNYDHVTYVFTDNQLEVLKKNNFDPLEEDATILIISAGSGISSVFSYGSAYYIDSDDYASPTIKDNAEPTSLPSSKKTAYLGKAGLYGAIFSETKSSYECTMNKALFRYKLLTLLQQEKINASSTEISVYCKQPLGLLQGSTGAKHLLDKILVEIAKGVSSASFGTLLDLQKQLDTKNKALSVEGNCPLIY